MVDERTRQTCCTQTDVTNESQERTNRAPPFARFSYQALFMAASHRRTSSREPLVGEDGTPEAPSLNEEEPELLEIYHKSADPPQIVVPSIFVDLSGPLRNDETHASASTSDISSAVATPPAPANSAFDKRLPKFLCCGCVCCLLVAIFLVFATRLAASNFEEEFSLTMEISPPPPPPAARLIRFS